MSDIADYIATLPIVDVHEHHMPGTFTSRDVGLYELLHLSYAGWTQQRSYSLPDEPPPEAPGKRSHEDTTWDDVRPFVEGSGSSTFVRNLVWALDELYQLGGQGITEANFRELDRQIRERHARETWCDELLDRAGVQQIVADTYDDPLLNAREALGPRYSGVLRINALAYGWHPESRDHNDNGAHEYAHRLARSVDSFDDYLDFLEYLVDTMPARSQVGMKNALAYDRTVDFDNPDRELARRAWGKADPSEDEKKAFGDFVVDRLCTLAGEREIPFQMHVGSAQIRGSAPLNAAGLIERHPKTRFLLMHLAYPWSRELLGLAFVYRNVWLDLTWSWLLSPTAFKSSLHEAIEVLPDESRMMLGGDCWHAEETYGTLQLARRLIGEVMSEKLTWGYFGQAEAERLCRRIFAENASAFFGLG